MYFSIISVHINTFFIKAPINKNASYTYKKKEEKCCVIIIIFLLSFSDFVIFVCYESYI